MTPLYPHQREAVDRLLTHDAFILGLDPGLGKSRVVTEAACTLATQGVIDTVIVVCPAPLRSIWADPDPVLGEWAKWATVWAEVQEYSVRHSALPDPPGLLVLVTNPEFLRREPRLTALRDWIEGTGRRVLLVLDESWLYQNPKATQTKAVWKLRKSCDRVVLLNGTLGELKHQWAQFLICSPDVFRASWYQVRARYARMGGYFNKEIVAYQHEDEYAEKTAPFVLVRKFRDCVDLEEPVRTQIEVPLDEPTWSVYRALRDEFVAWLDEAVATALQAGVRAMRLAQVVNGFVGGVETPDDPTPPAVRELGDEKLRALVAELVQTPAAKVLIFTRFRADVERTVRVLAREFPTHRVCALYGSQTAEEREQAKRLLAPGGDPVPAIVVANAASGGAGLNLTAAAHVYFLGNDYSRKTRVQAEGRVDRIGQTERTRFVDVLATGPNGERTIDHGIVAALRRQEELAGAPLDAWRRLMIGCA